MPVEGGGQLGLEVGDVVFFVVEGDDDGDHAWYRSKGQGPVVIAGKDAQVSQRFAPAFNAEEADHLDPLEAPDDGARGLLQPRFASSVMKSASRPSNRLTPCSSV